MPRFGDRRVRRIGLLGGSFNPAHAGHLQVAEVTLRRLGLDEVWLVVSPGNPLKPVAGMAPFSERLRSAEGIADGRRIFAVALEAEWHTRYTLDTVRLLKRRFPRAHFAWLMGADVLAELPDWRGWQQLVCEIPFAVVPRPGYTFAALAGCAAKRLMHARVPRGAGKLLLGAAKRPPRWVFVPRPDNAVSASGIRAQREGERAIASLPPDDVKWRERRKARGSAGQALKRAVAAPPAEGLAASVRKKAAVAGPRPTVGSRPAAKRRKAAEAAALEELQATIIGSLEDDKAVDIVTLDLVGRASFADRMVIATGLADRQITAMAQHLEEKLKAQGVKRLAIEGRSGAPWVLVDAGDIVVHLFRPEARALYALERMWGAELDPEEQASVG